MQEERNYLSDEEIEEMIAGMEQGPLVQAPEYLEKMILQKAERIAVRESVEIVPIRHAVKEGGQPLGRNPSKQGQLLAYSLKIVAAAAAAIALVITVPQMEQKTGDSYQQEQYMQEQSQKEDREKKSVARNINEKTSNFCNRLFEKTNEILFQREER